MKSILIAKDSCDVLYGDAVKAFYSINNGIGKSGFAFYMADDIQKYGETAIFVGEYEKCKVASEILNETEIPFEIQSL